MTKAVAVTIEGSQPLKNVRRERFCFEYLRLGVLIQAAAAAGYSNKNQKVLSVTSSRLFAKPSVRARVDYLRRNICEATRLNAVWIVTRQMQIADADIADCFDAHGNVLTPTQIPERTRYAIAGIDTEQRLERDGGDSTDVVTRKVRLSDKISALKALERWVMPELGSMDNPFHHEHEHEHRLSQEQADAVIRAARAQAHEKLVRVVPEEDHT